MDPFSGIKTYKWYKPEIGLASITGNGIKIRLHYDSEEIYR